MTSSDVYDRGSRSHATGSVSGSNYTVAAGDSFYSIGLRFGLPWQDVTRANDLADDAFVQPGTRLAIPGLNPVPPVKPPAGQPRLGINSPVFGSTIYAGFPIIIQGVGGNLRGGKILVHVRDGAGNEIARSETFLDAAGNWQVTFSGGLPVPRFTDGTIEAESPGSGLRVPITVHFR